MRTLPAWLRVVLAVLGGAASYAFTQLTAYSLRLDRDSWQKHEARVTLPPPRAARVMVMGYNELAADLAWSRALVYYGDGLIHDSTLADIDPLLALINALDPQFRRPYLWGAYSTTYRRRLGSQAEFRGSIAVLERGILAYPEDWELHWILGLRYYTDLRSDDPGEARKYKEIGAGYIERAMRLPGAPGDLPLLASSLRTELGQREHALRELREMILTTDDDKARTKLLARYDALSTKGMGAALDKARRAFQDEWMRHLPYAAPAMYVLIGEARPARSASELLAADDVLTTLEEELPPETDDTPPPGGE